MKLQRIWKAIKEKLLDCSLDKKDKDMFLNLLNVIYNKRIELENILFNHPKELQKSNLKIIKEKHKEFFKNLKKSKSN